MGMSASQARLCSITARMHDIEYKAQKVEAQKLQLALDKDSIYQTYTDALDKTKIQIAYRTDSGTFSYKDANFETVCTYQEGMAGQYALQDSSTGKVYLNRDQADLYELYKKAQMLQPIIDADNTIAEQKQSIIDNQGIMAEAKSYISSLETQNTAIGNQILNLQSKNDTDSEGNPISYISEITELNNQINSNSSEMASQESRCTQAEAGIVNAYEAIEQAEIDKENAIADYETIYGEGSAENYGEIYQEYQDATADWESGESSYYENLFQLVDNNDYLVLQNQYTTGDDGYTWFNNMVQAGLVTINQYIKTGSNPGWSETSVTTSVNDNYLKEVDDDAYVKKAEAEYEHALDLINDKDKKFDNELTKLETEEKALTEEIESLEKVRDDNSERTFGIFG